MAPVPLEPDLRYTGAALVGLHILSALFFTQRVASSLVQAYRDLPPAQDVRIRLARRRKLVPLFAGLALAALCTALYASWEYASLSFDFWAQQRSIGDAEHVPFFSEYGEAAVTTNSTKMQDPADMRSFVADRVRWLADTPIYQDGLEIVVEKARRFWWAQQMDLALVSWSTLVAVEGSRRGIPNLFAFQALAHLVNLSFAQNLFFVALLLTPSPLPTRPQQSRLGRWFEQVFPSKPRNWSVRPGVLLIFALGSYTAIFALPYASGTPFFSRVVGATRLLTFAPLVLHIVAPNSWGTVHSHQTKVDPALTDLFRFMSVMAVLLHGAATFSGLRYNIPHAHYHRHSKLLPWDIEERSRWERTTSAVGKLLGATQDHPVVAAVGYDVLLSGLSVGLWAAVRSLSADDILDAAVPLFKKRGEDATASSSRVNTVDATPARQSRRKGRPRKAVDGDEDENAPPTTGRRRGRPRKIKQQQESEDEDPGDKTYKPTPEESGSAERGDALPGREADLEAAGLAWGLISVGGLGLGCAGVFGGECLAW